MACWRSTSKTRWYNVWHICEQTSNINQMYSNLSMPAVRTDKGIEWVDLDLDYRVHMDGRLERLDEDEYRAHIASMGYSLEMQAQVQAACAEIEALYHAARRSLQPWRAGRALPADQSGSYNEFSAAPAEPHQ